MAAAAAAAGGLVAGAASRRAVRVALCQLSVGADKHANVARARQAVAGAAAKGAELVVLPEMWNCPYANESFPAYAEGPLGAVGVELDAESAPSAAALQQMSKEHGVVLVGGSVPERGAKGALYNSCLVFDSGAFVARHRKAHLFDIDIPGKITFRESDTLTAGKSVTVVNTRVGRLGVGICFDLRFPEYAQLCSERGADVLVFPAAFNTTTGPPHYRLLQQARAVDNQLFVCTASPARVPGAAYQAYGHSMAVGPFAEVLAEAGHEEETVVVDLPLEQIAERRRNMPLRQQKRKDMYSLADTAPSNDGGDVGAANGAGVVSPLGKRQRGP